MVGRMEPRNVLIIEDDPDVLNTLIDLVSQLPGWQAHGANTAHEARALLEARQWGAILTDEVLPDGSGLELLHEAAPRQPHAARALMSAHAVFQQLVEGLNMHLVDRFFPKPFDPAAIEAWLADAAKRSAKLPPSSDYGRIPLRPGDAWARVA